MPEGKGGNTIALSRTIRTRLEMRGIACSNDPRFIKLVPWLRTTFVLCGTLAALGTALAFTPLLWAMVPIAALGAILPVHPFDLIYNYGIRHLTKTQALPRNGAPTRFACGVAAVFLVATALAFGTGVAWLSARRSSDGCRRHHQRDALLHSVSDLPISVRSGCGPPGSTVRPTAGMKHGR